MKTTMIIVRHAEAVGNRIREFHGWTDEGITDRGKLQAQQVAERLKDTPIDVIYSSVLKRTRETAEHIAKVKGLPINTREDLKEINGGLWEGMRWDDLIAKYPKEYDLWENKPHLHQMPEGENMREFQQRVVNAVRDILRMEQGKNVCIVTHGTVIRALVCWFKGWELEDIVKVPWCDNTAVTVVIQEGDCFSIAVEGDASHLDETTSTFQNQQWYSEYREKFNQQFYKTNDKPRWKEDFPHSGVWEDSMENSTEKLIQGLFHTKAIRVCPADRPFWYTSGKIGPYYINTHFLYGSEEKANELLSIIDRAKEDKAQCSAIVAKQVRKNYQADAIYRDCIDTLLQTIEKTVPVDSIDYISGGERRDWFFSLMISELLNKPHITIFKDLDAFIFHQGRSEKMDKIPGARVCHIADLITSASSYERAWVPVIQNAGGQMKDSFVIIDRMQGGSALLESLGVASHALVKVDGDVFREACNKGYINPEQYQMVVNYMEDPDGFMKTFFLEHPDFIENALKSDEKTAQRARLCIESGFYPARLS